MEERTNFIIMSDHGMTYGMEPSSILEQHNIANFPFDAFDIKRVYMDHALRFVSENFSNLIVLNGSFSFFQYFENIQIVHTKVLENKGCNQNA